VSRTRTWTCRACHIQYGGNKKKCDVCGVARPVRKRPKHQMVLETPYELWVERFGERCGVCGRPPGPNRNLDRDHDHRTGAPRGLLCHRCNRALPDWVTADWLQRALTYLTREER
jgi:hypothetical protein